eukprot:TRINITY_DN67601_c4_g1_i1.p1 TRINITY_DN67601_c4_g1~~TRINITY_DN67601_c4_g1_i1.p1  ORF type:complete len:347 (+),score=21.50 TRINITY_DN67601_c4_g1_i1:81-1121(+)
MDQFEWKIANGCPAEAAVRFDSEEEAQTFLDGLPSGLPKKRVRKTAAGFLEQKDVEFLRKKFGDNFMARIRPCNPEPFAYANPVTPPLTAPWSPSICPPPPESTQERTIAVIDDFTASHGSQVKAVIHELMHCFGVAYKFVPNTDCTIDAINPRTNRRVWSEIKISNIMDRLPIECHVANISGGSPFERTLVSEEAPVTPIQESIQQAQEAPRSTVVCVAAGNDANKEVCNIAQFPETLSVGGLEKFVSSFGNQVEWKESRRSSTGGSLLNKPEVHFSDAAIFQGQELNGTSFAAPQLTSLLAAYQPHWANKTNPTQCLRAALKAARTPGKALFSTPHFLNLLQRI